DFRPFAPFGAINPNEVQNVSYRVDGLVPDKTFSSIRRNWNYYERDPSQGFDVLLEWCINVVGVKEENARGHFRHAGLETNVCHL
ncbi:Pc32g00010, partial [Penicillium rubens Wisconsin 54-1255]